MVDVLLVGMVFGLWMIVLRTSPEWIGPRSEDLGSGLGYAEALEDRRNITRWLVAAMLTTTALVALANTVVAQGITGRTLGKLITGQRLIRAGTGRPAGIGRALLRQIAHILDVLPCYLGYVWPIFDEQRRTFADMVTRTVVVESARASRRSGGDALPQGNTRLHGTGGPAVGTGEPPVARNAVESWDLFTRVRETGPLPEEEVRRIGTGIAHRLAERHVAGYVHGGLAPGTVTGTAFSVDIGPVVPLTEGAGYLAPEVVAGAPADPAADMFSLGAVLVFAATGHGPFGTGSPAELLDRASKEPPDTHGVPAGILPVIHECLSRTPAQRPRADRVAEMLAGPPKPATAAPALPLPAALPPLEPAPVTAGPAPGLVPGGDGRPETGPGAVIDHPAGPAAQAGARRKYLVAAGAAVAVLVLVSATVAAGTVILGSVDSSATEATTDVHAPPALLRLHGVEAVALSPDGRYAYVSEGFAMSSTTATVAVVETATGTLEGRIEVDAEAELKALAVSPDGNRLYGVAWGALLVIDTASRRLVETIDMVTGSQTLVSYTDNSGARHVGNLDVSISFDKLVISGDGRRIYATGGAHERIWLYDTETRRPIAPAVQGPDPWIDEASLSADGSRLYLGVMLETVQLTRAIVALDAVTMAEVGRYPIPEGAGLGFAAATDNTNLYWSDTTSFAELFRLDTRTGAATALIRMRRNVHDLAVSPSGRYLFIAHDRTDEPDTDLGRITVLDTQSKKIVDRIDIAARPDFVALSPDGQRLYAASTSESPEPERGRFVTIDTGKYR